MKEEDEKELNEHSFWHNRKQEKTGGRPKKWTDEAVEDFAKELLAWSETDDAFHLTQFVQKYDYMTPILNKLASIHPFFRRCLNESKRRIGVRRELGTLNKKFEPKVHAMTARLYDPELCDHLSATLAKDELIKAQAKIKALNQELKNKGEILDYLEAQKVLKEVTE